MSTNVTKLLLVLTIFISYSYGIQMNKKDTQFMNLNQQSAKEILRKIEEKTKEDTQKRCMKVNPWIKNIDEGQRPIIGVLTQPIYFLDPKFSKGEKNLKPAMFKGFKSFFAGTYVKWLEQAGAKVVPLIYTEGEDILKKKISQLNGVLLPGGGGDNIKAGQFILDEVIKQNEAGNFIPLWGTCLGFFRLSTATAKNKKFNLFTKCDGGCMDLSIPIQFQKEPTKTKMYCDLGEKAHRLTKGNFLFNSHAYSLTLDTFKKDKHMTDFWDVTSTSPMKSKNSTMNFVASMESKKYPIMATIFHPDRMTDEFLNDRTSVNNNIEAIDLNRHFGDFLINMAQANKNSWKSEAELQKSLVQNYHKVFSGLNNINYKGDLYLFK